MIATITHTTPHRRTIKAIVIKNSSINSGLKIKPKIQDMPHTHVNPLIVFTS